MLENLNVLVLNRNLVATTIISYLGTFNVCLLN